MDPDRRGGGAAKCEIKREKRGKERENVLISEYALLGSKLTILNKSTLRRNCHDRACALQLAL